MKIPDSLKKICKTVGVLIEKNIDSSVEFSVPNRWSSFESREVNRQTNSITDCASGE
jgi:hypothetical protein